MTKIRKYNIQGHTENTFHLRKFWKSFPLRLLHYLCTNLVLSADLLASFNDTHWEKLCFTQFSTWMAGWLLLTFLICLHNQLSSIMHSVHVLRVQMFEKCVHQIDSKNEWWLLPASFTVKFGLVFVVTLKNAFC